MKMLCTKSGKCGHFVTQRARYGMICYPAFIPSNPRSTGQCFVRGNFGSVSKRWRTIAQAHRNIWDAIARTILSRPRLGQCGPLAGFHLFVKINVALANRGLPQVDLPPPAIGLPQPAVSSPFDPSQSALPPVGPMTFLRAHGLIDAWLRDRRQLTPLLSAPT